MNVRDQSTLDLLARLLGKRRAKALFQGSLIPLFQPTAGREAVEEKLQAAHELVRRWLEERLAESTVIDSPKALRTLLGTLVQDRQCETFSVLFLDNRHRIISIEEMFRGTIDSAHVYPREIARRVLQVNAAAVLLVHNHPSGVAEPSQADTVITIRVKEALELIDVRVLDHCVIGAGEMVSLAERGII